jgi:CheY-like chemotaxis protein
LIIDDNAQAREVLASMLISMTFVVDEAPSGQEASSWYVRRPTKEPYEIASIGRCPASMD